MTDRAINTSSIRVQLNVSHSRGLLIVPGPHGRKVLIVIFSKCNLFPGIFLRSLSLLLFDIQHLRNETLILSCSYINLHFHSWCRKCKTSLNLGGVPSHREGVICIHCSVEHHQTGSRDVFTALLGGCARTGFSLSRQSRSKDCRAAWK